jgi:competence protein ComFB
MAFESVQNYYENLVFTEIRQAAKKRKDKVDDDYLEDVACVALNHLPTRYVRHHVDLAFYLTSEERQTIDDSVKTAVADAFAFVDKERR